MLRVITEDGYRDLTKYGFERDESDLDDYTTEVWFEKWIEETAKEKCELLCTISCSDWIVTFHSDSEDYENNYNNLDFLYDMIKDGVIEKVEK